MRGADSGPPDMLLALSAFWVGLLYDDIAQDEAQQVIREWSIGDIQAMHRDAPKKGLTTAIGNRTLMDVAQDIVAISIRGLRRRAKMHNGHDESAYLALLVEIANTGRTHAQRMIEMVEKTGSVQQMLENYQVNF
jgi:glutamate--cysteine ligase